MDTTKLWKDVLESVRVSVSGAYYSTWFSQTSLVSVRPGGEGRQVVEIGCPNAFIADGLESRYFTLIQDSLNQITGLKNELVFSVQQVQKVSKTFNSPLFEKDEAADSAFENSLKKSRIRAGFTFENFAVSTSNQMAHAAADAVSKSLGDAYNPLFFWGGVGIGKTHLMLAIGNYFLRHNPGGAALYVMGEEFTTEIVEAIRNKNTQEFKKRYRSLKLLMLDDVQFIAGKEKVQEEFFHTFNTILREGGQVVLTSDRPPSEIQKLEERLRTRFEAGMVIDISPPDFELRTAISLIKAQQKGMALDMDVAQTIAANIDNPRRIEGFLTRMLAETNGFKEKITIELVNKILGKTNGILVTKAQKATVPQELIDAVCDYYSLGKRKLLGVTRVRPVAWPRQVLMYLLRVELGLPLQEVGRLVGGRDHTTVMHAVDKVSGNLSTNSPLRNDILGIKKYISG